MFFAPAKNRRQWQRHWVAVPVLIHNSGTRIDGLSINISERGMYLFAAAHLAPGKQIEIEFRRPGSTELVRATGEVRRRALYLYAIEFLSVESAWTHDRSTVQAENTTHSESERSL